MREDLLEGGDGLARLALVKAGEVVQGPGQVELRVGPVDAVALG